VCRVDFREAALQEMFIPKSTIAVIRVDKRNLGVLGA